MSPMGSPKRSECDVIHNALSHINTVTIDRIVSFHILQEGANHHNKVQFNENFSTKVVKRKGLSPGEQFLNWVNEKLAVSEEFPEAMKKKRKENK